jgi:hypothetical protein
MSVHSTTVVGSMTTQLSSGLCLSKLIDCCDPRPLSLTSHVGRLCACDSLPSTNVVNPNSKASSPRETRGSSLPLPLPVDDCTDGAARRASWLAGFVTPNDRREDCAGDSFDDVSNRKLLRRRDASSAAGMDFSTAALPLVLNRRRLSIRGETCAFALIRSLSFGVFSSVHGDQTDMMA